MKRSLGKILCLCAAVGLSSCAADELLSSSASEVSFTVTLPEDIATRSFSDGLTATYLTYAVYRVNDSDEQKLMVSKLRTNCLSDGEAKVNIPLASGQDYKIVFWADAGPKSPYTLDLEAGTMTMDYATESSLAANDENRDAFYAVVELTKVDGQTKSQSATLSRPFAQLNFGTDDLQRPIVASNAPVADITFSVKMPAGLATTLSLIDGTVSGATENVITFSAQGTPNDPFPVDGYSYAAMNYILCGANNAEEKEVLSDPVAFTASHAGLGDDVVCTVYNVPLQRNFRTNIYGSLITSPTAYEVEIEPYYDDKYHYILYKGEWYRVYETEEELQTALEAGGYVALGCDVTITASGLYMTAAGKIDLNGYTLTLDSLRTNGYNTVICNGTIHNTRSLCAYNKSSSLTLQNVDLVCDARGLTGPIRALYATTNCTLNVIDSNILLISNSDGDYRATAIYAYGNVNVSGSTITVQATGTLYPRGVQTYYGKSESLTITNSVISVEAPYVEYSAYGTACGVVSGSKTTTVDSCSISVVAGGCVNGLYLKTGKSTVSNSYIYTGSTMNTTDIYEPSRTLVLYPTAIEDTLVEHLSNYDSLTALYVVLHEDTVAKNSLTVDVSNCELVARAGNRPGCVYLCNYCINSTVNLSGTTTDAACTSEEGKNASDNIMRRHTNTENCSSDSVITDGQNKAKETYASASRCCEVKPMDDDDDDSGGGGNDEEEQTN